MFHFLLLITAAVLNEVGRGGHVVNTAELPGPWPQFRHGFDNTGFTPTAGPSGLGISQPVVKNDSLPTKDSVLSSPVIDDDGNVYVVTTKGMLVGYAPDKSLKVNVTVNTTRSVAMCNVQTSGDIPSGRQYYHTWLSASPAVIKPGVIAASVEGHFFLLDSRTPGKVQRWRFQLTSGSCYSAALLGDGEVVITSQSAGRVFALDLSKEPPDSRWALSVNQPIYAGPSVASDATVYVLSHGGLGSSMRAITAAGKLAHYSWELSSIPLTSAAIWSCVNEVTYNLSTGQGTYVCSVKQNNIGYVFVGTVNGLDVLERGIEQQNVKPVWSFNFAEQNKAVVQSSPAVYVSNDLQVYVFVASYNGMLYSLDGLQKHIRHQIKLAGPIVSSPAVDANGTVFVITVTPATVYAIDGRTLDILWSKKTNDEVVSSPAIGKDGSLYFASITGRLHRFYNVTSELIPTSGPTTVPTTNATTPTTHATTPTTHATTPTTHATTPTTHAATPTTHATTPTSHATTPTTDVTTPTTHATTPTTHATTLTTHATTPTTHTSTPTTHTTTPSTHATTPTTPLTTQPPTSVTTSTGTHKPSRSKTFGAMSETEFIAVCVSGFAVLIVVSMIIYCGCYKEKDKFSHETLPLRRGATTNTYESVNL